ncbi:SMI1/KNR4 family protein [Catellatospora sp. NPDC049133]|uniref:SMI1/KNR4 family protein n=1 Tax=Catellatospora sp. NPDC049133 TaxID=3155499 RepID=UPI003409A4D0
MEFEQFDRLVEPLRARAATFDRDRFKLIEGRTATPEEITEAERALGATLPAQYKVFMERYGGGMFGFVDLLPVRVGRSSKESQDIVTVSRAEFPDGSAVALAPVGTGDFWGFPVEHGRCRGEVWFYYHDDDEPSPVAEDFLGFVARHGIQAGRG